MPERTLTAALEAARVELIDMALAEHDAPEHDAHVLAAQAYGVEVLTRLATHEPDEALAELEARHTALVDAAAAVVQAVIDADLTGDHFVGVFGGLAGPLENLSRAAHEATR